MSDTQPEVKALPQLDNGRTNPLKTGENPAEFNPEAMTEASKRRGLRPIEVYREMEHVFRRNGLMAAPLTSDEIENPLAEVPRQKKRRASP
jgi:hypothetical protein